MLIKDANLLLSADEFLEDFNKIVIISVRKVRVLYCFESSEEVLFIFI